MLAHLYPEVPAVRLERQAQDIASSRVAAGVSYPSDVKAGMALGRKVAERVIRYADADGSDRKWNGKRVSEGAVQWRIRWRCTRGRFAVSVNPAPREDNPLTDDRCAGKGEATTIDTGKLRLEIGSGSRWRAVIEQQVTDPVEEAPLPAMKAGAAQVLSRGRFYPIERRGSGTAVLYELPNDRLALRLEGFSTSANTDLFVWASQAERPRTTKQALRTPHDEFALLKSTLGNQNYLLPRGADADSIRSIVIWCEPIRIAYTAATLR